MTYPNEVYPADSAILALDGTTDSPTGLLHVAKNTGPNSTPSLQIQLNRRWNRQNAILAVVNQGRVVDEGGLDVGVFPLLFRYQNAEKSFAGVTGQTLSDNTTTYIWLDSSAALQTGASFPGDPTTYLPLAKITTAGGDVTEIEDKRPSALFEIPLWDPGTGFASAGANSDITSLTALSTSITLSQGGTGAVTAAGARTSLEAAKTGANSDITSLTGLTTPLTVAQGGTGAGTLTGVVKGNGTGPLTASTVDLTSEVVGALPVANGGTGATSAADARSALSAAEKGSNSDITEITGLTTALSVAQGGTGQTTANTLPYSPTIHLPGTLAVKVYEIEWVAPVAFTLLNATGRVATAPTGDTLIADVRVNGSSIFANQTEMINVAAASQQDVSATKSHSVSAGDVITVEVEQIGSSAAGSDLTVVLNGRTAIQT